MKRFSLRYFGYRPENWKSIDARDVARGLLAEALAPAMLGVTILTSSQLREKRVAKPMIYRMATRFTHSIATRHTGYLTYVKRGGHAATPLTRLAMSSPPLYLHVQPVNTSPFSVVTFTFDDFT